MVVAKTADGRALPPEVLKRYLTKERLVLVSADGEPIDPFWLTNLQPNVVGLVAPVPELGGFLGRTIFRAPAAAY